MFKLPKPTNMDLNLAPMVDVMMCLIIFFLLASKLAEREQYRVDLPWAAAAKEVENQRLGRRVTISVRKTENSDQVAEFVVADWDGEQVVDRVLQPDEIESLLRARSVRALQDKQEFRCVVRADKDVQYQHVEVVLRACGKAKVKNVVFSAMSGIEPPPPGGTQ